MAAGRGSSFDSGPTACPFIALELDRDRRSERPDYRHRCYAEQVPAPRTIAHQERYCLSPNFSGCPIFADWALRAAARPVPLPPGYEGRNTPPDPRAAAGAGAAAATVGAAAASSQVWPDSMESDVPAPADAPPEQQLSAFDADEPPSSLPPASPLTPAPVVVPIDAAAQAPGPLAPAEPHAAPDFEPEDAAVPAFLAGRSSRPPRPPDPTGSTPRRDEVVPSWELTDQYGAQGGGGDTGDDSFFKRFLTMIAVVVILAIGVAAVVILPNMLGGSASSTARPSLPPRASVSLLPSGSASLSTPTSAVTGTPVATAAPTAAATPAPTPRLYRIKAGDTMAKIARKYGITVADILAANPEIPDANHIEVGQFIIIPLPLVPPPS